MAAEITVAELDKVYWTGTQLRTRVADRLFLMVKNRGTSNHSASWVLRYTHEGKKQDMGLGSYYPHGTAGMGRVSLAEAVKRAKAELAKIDGGIHPVKAKKAKVKEDARAREEQAELENHTVRKAAELWHEATKAELTSDKYSAQRWRRLEEYLTILGERPVSELTVAHVSAAIRELKKPAPATSVSKGRKADRIETLWRSGSDLEKVLKYARSIGWLKTSNPVTDALDSIGKKPEKVSRRTFTMERLPDYARAVHDADQGRQYPVTARLLRLMTFIPGRTKELRLLEWEHIEGLDTEEPTVHVPVENMKKRKAWSTPLSRQAADILREVRGWQAAAGAGLRGVTDGFVFVHLEGNYKGRKCSENAVNDWLKVMGWHTELTGHGLRPAFTTAMFKRWHGGGENKEVILEYCEARVMKNKMRGTYDRNAYMEERREALQWWADHLDLLRQPPATNVVPIRAA